MFNNIKFDVHNIRLRLKYQYYFTRLKMLKEKETECFRLIKSSSG